MQTAERSRSVTPAIPPPQVIHELSVSHLTRLEKLARLDAFTNDAFPSQQNGRNLARTRIKQVHNVSETDEHVDVHRVLLDKYVGLMGEYRCRMLRAVKQKLAGYDFDAISDTLPSDCIDQNGIFKHINDLGRFLKKDFDEKNSLFTSEFFLDVYQHVFLNGLAHEPRLRIEDTCAPSMCLLLVAIKHVLSALTTTAPTETEATTTTTTTTIGRKRRRVTTTSANNFARGSDYEVVYHALLTEDTPGLFVRLNQGEVIDWELAVDDFTSALIEYTGGDNLPVERSIEYLNAMF
ncbi:unnamed protein product [Absidia cylindrospora]